MSLFSPKSTILQLIQEAENFTVSPDMEMPQDTGIDVGDITSEMSSQPAPATPVSPVTGAQLPIAAIPQPQTSVPTTMSKTVVNADAIRNQLTELKSVLITYEKKFEDSDMSIEQSTASVGSLINVLVHYATELQKFLELGAAPEATPAPVSEPITQEPTEPTMPPTDAEATSTGDVV